MREQARPKDTLQHTAKHETTMQKNLGPISPAQYAFISTVQKPIDTNARYSILSALLLQDLALWGLGSWVTMACLSLTHSALQYDPLTILVWNAIYFALFTGLVQYYKVEDSAYALGKALWVSTLVSIFGGMSTFLLVPHTTIPSLGFLTLVTLFFSTLSGVLHHQICKAYSYYSKQGFFFGLEKALKRCFDIVLSSVGMLMILPLLLTITVLVLLDGQGSPLYVQNRVGLKEKVFPIFKFRSMVNNAASLHEVCQQKLFKSKSDPRITPLGHLLRKLSLDELPQLWNVTCGHMSLVGPRPPLIAEYEQMSAYHRRKFEVTPGMTGLWQVTGRIRNERDFNAVATYDTQYVDQWSLTEDLKILLKTIPVVLLQKGAC